MLFYEKFFYELKTSRSLGSPRPGIDRKDFFYTKNSMVCLMQRKPSTNVPLPVMYTFPRYHFFLCTDKRGELWLLWWWSRSFQMKGKHYRFCLWMYGFGWCRQGHMQVVNLQKTHLTCTNTNICTSWGFLWLTSPHIHIMLHQPSAVWSEFFIVLEVRGILWIYMNTAAMVRLLYPVSYRTGQILHRTAAKCSLAW